MMRRFLAALVVLSALVAPALPARGVELGVAVYGTVGGLAMQNVNDVVKTLNEQLTASMLPVRFETIDVGTSYGVGLHSPLGERLLLGVEWERLVASTAVGGPLDRNTIRTDADIWRGSLAVDLVPESKFRFGAEVGVGYLTSRASQTIFRNDVQTLRTDLDGSGATYHASMFFGAPATTTIEFSVGLGYRWAKLDNLSYSLTANLPQFPPEPLGSLDWSGIYGRAGFTVFVL